MMEVGRCSGPTESLLLLCLTRHINYNEALPYLALYVYLDYWIHFAFIFFLVKFVLSMYTSKYTCKSGWHVQNFVPNHSVNARELKISSCVPSQEVSIFTLSIASRIVTVHILSKCLGVKSVNFSLCQSPIFLICQYIAFLCTLYTVHPQWQVVTICMAYIWSASHMTLCKNISVL